MGLVFTLGFSAVLLALAGFGSDTAIMSAIAIVMMVVFAWLLSTLWYIRSGQWEIDRRLRTL